MCLPSQRNDNQTRLDKFVIKKQFKNLNNFERSGAEVELDDVLSITTHYTKQICEQIGKYFKRLQNSSAYKITFRTTQPAHLITVLAVAVLMFLLYPSHHQEVHSKLLNFVYLGSFAMYLGAQVWMTFISGLSLYFSLPRHDFGNVQKVLFPKYFALNSALCLLMVTIFARHHSCEIGGSQVPIQISVLSASFLINLLTRLYLAPPLLKLMTAKNRIEKSAGIGMEVGEYDLGSLKQCPHYVGIYKTFRKFHMGIAIGNITTMGFSIFHLYYLSGKLCLL